MLEIRPSCEHCDTDLPYNATDAMICTFECTYCEACAIELFKNVCPNCGGGFVPRPIRPAHHLVKYPVSTQRIHKPKDFKETDVIIRKYVRVKPENR